MHGGKQGKLQLVRMYDTSFNRIIISTAALENNYSVMRSCLDREVPLMAMVKADGYGHGMVEAACVFSRAGCRLFGVAELCEGVRLREAGIQGEIFVTIGFEPKVAELLFQYDLTPVIYDIDAARALGVVAAARKQSINVHIKVDTGMSRLGLFPDDLSAFLDALKNIPGLHVSGIMSHFPQSDDPAAESTSSGLKALQRAVANFNGEGPGCCHIANSGGVINFAESHCSMARSGISLYGYHPAGSNGDPSVGSGTLQPAMSFTSRVLQVKTLPAGTGISYGHTWKTQESMRIATLPVGYEDGFSRLFSNNGTVLIRGEKAPVRGRVCMNMCMVDVTAIDGVCAGDEVVLLGTKGQAVISADELADRIGTISYELLCSLGNNNQREYRK